ncbi:hypothetical protein C8R43DRAFT_829619, partial [Mycena crocata]
LAMDNYFKICRAHEEIVRLNIEIRWVVTWIEDEDEFLQRRERELEESNTPEMAILVQRYRCERARFDADHMKRFWELAKSPGFTGSVVPG